MNTIDFLATLYMCSGGLLSILSLALILKKVPPNGLYGFRVKKTMENPDIWYPANAYAGKWLLATGLLVAAAAIGLRFIPGISEDTYAYGILAIFAAVFTLGIIASVRYMNSL